MTPKQHEKINQLRKDYKSDPISVIRGPFDLPNGWVEVTFLTNNQQTITFGIDPDGNSYS